MPYIDIASQSTLEEIKARVPDKNTLAEIEITTGQIEEELKKIKLPTVLETADEIKAVEELGTLADSKAIKELFEESGKNYDVLETIDEIKGNTEKGKLADALVIKELINEGASGSLVHMIISYDPEIAGATITATNGEETHTVEAHESGTSFIDGKGLGTWTISEDMYEAEATFTAIYYGNYFEELSNFKSYITVTYPEGATCSYTDSERTVTAPDTSGTWNLTLKGGSYTFTIRQDDKESERTVVVESSEPMSIELQFLKIVSWTNGTDEEIVAMVAAADAGAINLGDYWEVGQERVINLGSMSTVTGIDESQSAQQATFVLMNKGGKTLTNGKECSFIVGMKDCLNTTGKMNTTNTNAGGWNSAPRRNWCNTVFRNAIPSTLRPIFKEYQNLQSKGGTTSSKKATGTETTNDYFAFPAEMEIFGAGTYSATDEQSALSGKQWEWYKTTSNRIKNINGSSSVWWERSSCTYTSSATSFCRVTSGAALSSAADIARGLSPVGCI